jgi:hypothetical protein
MTAEKRPSRRPRNRDGCQKDVSTVGNPIRKIAFVSPHCLPIASSGLAGGPTTISTFDLDNELVSQTDPDSNSSPG